MTKKCLLVQSKNSADWAIRFFQDINQGLLDVGVETTLGISDPEELAKLWSAYIDELEPGSTINIFGMNTFPRIDVHSLPPRISGLNSISWMGDSPAHQIDRMIGLSQSTHLGFVDAGHLELCREFGLDFPMSFLPHGGPAVENQLRSFDDRDIDFLFSGTLNEVVSFEEWKDQNPNVPGFIADLVFSATELLVSSRITPFDAWKSRCGDTGFDFRAQLRPEDCLKTLSVIEGLAQSLRRKNVLSSISPERSLYIATPTLPDYLKGRPNVVFLGWTEFHELYELFQRTRIVLNPQSKFSQGSHERIWYPMAAGAVVATDESQFVLETFTHGESIVILPWGDTSEEFQPLSALAGDCQTLESIRATALPIYSANHLWKNRANLIADLLV